MFTYSLWLPINFQIHVFFGVGEKKNTIVSGNFSSYSKECIKLTFIKQPRRRWRGTINFSFMYICVYVYVEENNGNESNNIKKKLKNKIIQKEEFNVKESQC